MNRRELLRDVGVAAAVASPVLAGSASQAQVPIGRLNVLVAYHSVTRNTEKMAQGVAEGANAISNEQLSSCRREIADRFGRVKAGASRLRATRGYGLDSAQSISAAASVPSAHCADS